MAQALFGILGLLKQWNNLIAGFNYYDYLENINALACVSLACWALNSFWTDSNTQTANRSRHKQHILEQANNHSMWIHVDKLEVL